MLTICWDGIKNLKLIKSPSLPFCNQGMPAICSQDGGRSCSPPVPSWSEQQSSALRRSVSDKHPLRPEFWSEHQLLTVTKSSWSDCIIRFVFKWCRPAVWISQISLRQKIRNKIISEEAKGRGNGPMRERCGHLLRSSADAHLPHLLTFKKCWWEMFPRNVTIVRNR